MVHGFSFTWLAFKSPYFTKPSGEKIFCDVHAYVPYIWHRDPEWDEATMAAAATSVRNRIVPVKRIQFNEIPEEEGGGNAPAPSWDNAKGGVPSDRGERTPIGRRARG